MILIYVFLLFFSKTRVEVILSSDSTSLLRKSIIKKGYHYLPYFQYQIEPFCLY